MPEGTAAIVRGWGMYGRVQFPTHRGDSAEAVLDETGHWHCDKLPVLVRVLDSLYAVGRDGADTPIRAREQLNAAARWLKGTVGD